MERTYIKYYREVYLYVFSLCKNYYLAEEMMFQLQNQLISDKLLKNGFRILNIKSGTVFLFLYFVIHLW